MSGLVLHDLSVEHGRHPAVHHVSGRFAPGSLTAGLASTGAATFDFYRKGPGEAAFVKVVDLSQNHEYSATGLAAGTYLLQGQGHNSGGYGPMSAERAVVVG